jgi:hypothetical protein
MTFVILPDVSAKPDITIVQSLLAAPGRATG